MCSAHWHHEVSWRVPSSVRHSAGASSLLWGYGRPVLRRASAEFKTTELGHAVPSVIPDHDRLHNITIKELFTLGFLPNQRPVPPMREGTEFPVASLERHPSRMIPDQCGQRLRITWCALF